MSLRYYLAILTVFFFLLTIARTPSVAAGPQPNGGQRVLSLSLLEAVNLALKNNLPLQSSRRDINFAASTYRAAMAGYYPKVQVNLTSQQFLSTFAVGTTGLQSSQVYTGGLNLTASMPLDLSGAIGRSVQQALIGFVKAKASYVVSSQTLIGQVYQQYYELLRSLDTVKIDQGQLDYTSEQLRIAQERLKTGRVPAVDVLTAKVQYDNARQNLKVDEGLVEIAKSQLRNTMVIPQDVDIIATDSLTFQPETIKFEPGLKEALENRVEIKTARLSLQAAHISLKSTYDPYLPTLSITGGYGYNIAGRNPSEGWQNRPTAPTYSYGGTLTVPLLLFDGGVIRENKVRALIGIEQAQANLKESQETVAFEVKNNLVTMDNSRERVEIGKESVELARETLRIAEMRYGLGVSGYLEVTDSRNNLRTAEVNNLSAIISYNNAKIGVYRVLGRPLINISTSELSAPLPSLEGEKKVLNNNVR
jgi:outer membrane protein